MTLGRGKGACLPVAWALLAALAAALALAAPAAAEVRSGSTTDPVESERVPPGLDIVAVSAAYDTVAGAISTVVTTAGPPELGKKPLLGVAFGTFQSGECVAPRAAMAGAYSEPLAAAWAFGAQEGKAQMNSAGSATTISVAAPVLAGQQFDCVEPEIAVVVGSGEFETVEGLASPLRLAGRPPAPPAPAAPAPPPVSPPPPPKVANLSFPSLKLLTVKRNRWKKVEVPIANTGNATAANVSLTLGKAKGVALEPKSGKVTLKSIAPGKSKAASFEVLLTRKAKATSSISLKLTGAKGLQASGRLTIKAWTRKRGKKGKKEPPAPVDSPLSEKIFYGYEMHPSESATLIGYAFVDGEWAYHGIPQGGLPHCAEVTGNAEKEGCVKYAYDPKTGTIQIGSLPGGKILGDGSLEIDGEKYSPTYVPPAGSRYDVRQEYISYYGLCGLITGCSTTHQRVQLSGNGEFILAKESLTTAGGSGPGETFVAAGSYPPDQHGTYAVEPMGRIKLSFADGSVQTKTFAILLNKEGKPDPVNEGFLFDSTYFTFLPAT